jgi:hypothetical protein
MDAELILSRIEQLIGNAFQQFVLWRVPVPVRGSAHFYKYRFALVVDEVCVMRYDNEAGKGDHKHIGEVQLPYAFVDTETLLTDFEVDVVRWFNENGRD